MEEERKKHLPVPSNFVTLVQLQERWLEEKQRKQREKGKEEEQTRREKKEEEERKRGDQENLMRQNENEERSKKNTLSRRRPVSRRNQSEKKSSTIVTIERKSEESQVGAIVVGDGERKIDDLNKKKKRNKNKSKWKTKGKARAEEDLTGGTKQSLPEYKETEEKIPVVLTERDGEKEGVTSKFQRNGKNLVVNDMVCEKKVPVARSAEIGRKFKCTSLTEIKGVSLTEIKGVSLTEIKGVSLTEIKGVSLTEIEGVSLSGGKGVNERYPWNMHGSDRNNRGGSARLDSRRLQKPRDSSLVWVRKGDTSDVNVAGAWSSGGLAKAEKARRN